MRAIAIKILTVLSMSFVLSSCGNKTPRNVTNSCDIFGEKGGWYKHAWRSYKKWGVPVSVQMAIIYQESRFVHNAKTPRRKLLWVIPWFRQSSAFGYGQVKTATWKWYKKSTGKRFVDRDKFKDVVYFIGWYADQSHRRNGIAKTDAYSLYLAYHEGHGGYARGTYRRKKWLLKVARKVQQRAQSYSRQMRRCQHKLKKGWRIWPF